MKTRADEQEKGGDMPADTWKKQDNGKGRHGYGSRKSQRLPSTPPAKPRSLCDSSGPVVFLSFGKHKGKPLTEIPSGYLVWILRECEIHTSTRTAILEALRRCS